MHAHVLQVSQLPTAGQEKAGVDVIPGAKKTREVQQHMDHLLAWAQARATTWEVCQTRAQARAQVRSISRPRHLLLSQTRAQAQAQAQAQARA